MDASLQGEKIAMNVPILFNHPIAAWQSEITVPRWRHQIETFSALLALYEGNPSVTPSRSFWRHCNGCRRVRHVLLQVSLLFNDFVSCLWPGWRDSKCVRVSVEISRYCRVTILLTRICCKIPARISNYVRYKGWEEMPNFNGRTVK